MDLLRQVVTNSIGLNIFGGAGRQVDFLRWEPVICLVVVIYHVPVCVIKLPYLWFRRSFIFQLFLCCFFVVERKSTDQLMFGYLVKAYAQK